jgi:hypothetical protein
VRRNPLYESWKPGDGEDDLLSGQVIACEGSSPKDWAFRQDERVWRIGSSGRIRESLSTINPYYWLQRIPTGYNKFHPLQTCVSILDNGIQQYLFNNNPYVKPQLLEFSSHLAGYASNLVN